MEGRPVGSSFVHRLSTNQTPAVVTVSARPRPQVSKVSVCVPYPGTMMNLWLLLTSLITAMASSQILAQEPLTKLEEAIRDDPDLSQFYSLLEKSKLVKTTIQFRQATIFAPTNQAFQRYKQEIKNDESLVIYHTTNLAQTLDQLSSSVNSELDGNPPLWITHAEKNGHHETYINNAKIIKRKSNQIFRNPENKKQVLHVIDEVLVPIWPSTNSNDNAKYPDAYEFLTRSENFDIDHHRVRSFRQRVEKIPKGQIYKNEGRHTFFIPVDEGFKPQPRPDLIDARVVDGHVIPNMVLFTNPTPEDIPYETLAMGDNIKVTISFSKSHDGQMTQTYVKSNTLTSGTKHPTGVVLADIVKANIPVKNGVVHLIQRPLMIVDTSVTQFLEDKEDGPLFKFYEVIMDLGGELMQHLAKMQDVTLFAPSNEAWEDSNLNNLIRDKEKLTEILNLHIVRERLPVDRIINSNAHNNQLFQVPTAADRKYLYFNIVHHGKNQTLTVEGGGVNATIIQPNIAATNGFVHIINRVLGVPFTTIFEKLRTDPMLNNTYYLGKRRHFNGQLNESNHRYTYFVPRDKAWRDFELEYPSVHKKIFMDDFAYHTKQILERHLVMSDRAYSMADLKLMSNNSDGIVLPTPRDTLRLRVKESEKNYYVEWENKWIHVFRPDVECTNGIIHVLDYPFLRESDIQVTGAALSLAANYMTILFPNIIMLTIAKWLMH